MGDELQGEKSAFKSQTIQGNILAILSTVGGVIAAYKGGTPVDVFIPVVTAGALSLWGNILSIFGRTKATQKIK